MQSFPPDPITSGPQQPATPAVAPDPAAPDLTTLDDDQLITQRAAVRTRLGELRWHDLERMELENQYADFTDEFDRRARAAWQQATPRPQGDRKPPVRH